MQLTLIQCQGFKKKELKKVKEPKHENVRVNPVPVLPVRLEGKIKQCEECRTIQEVEIFECMYLCEPCYAKLANPQEPKIIRDSYPKRYLCKTSGCDSKAVMFDEKGTCFCVIHALELLGDCLV